MNANMKILILGEDIIPLFPELILKKVEGISILVTNKLIQNVIERKQDQIHFWIHYAINAKLNDNVKFIENFDSDLRDKNLLIYLSQLRNEGADIYVATEDNEVKKMCDAIGLSVIDAAKLKEYVGAAIQDKIPIDNLTFNLFLGLALLSITAFFFSIDKIIVVSETTSKTIITLLLIVAGFFLFTIRERFRLAYAILEIGVGISVICTSYSDTYSGILKEVGGLYIMVRGLDNISKALKDMKLIKLERLFRQYLLLPKIKS